MSGVRGRIIALVAPHIDLAVGRAVYAASYRLLKGARPKRVVALGVGHSMMNSLFSITGKDFETPLGVLRGDPSVVRSLKERGRGLISQTDFDHRAEHSIEFQTLFLSHLLEKGSFGIIPILCGPVRPGIEEYSREAYLEKAGPFLDVLRGIVNDPDIETLVVAGVDLSHTGPKFGHDLPASHLQSQSERHDRRLLDCLVDLDADGYWKESNKVMDRFNVCGFSALACLLELLPPCKGELLDYKIWHEEATQSAVSFAAVAFTAGE